VRSANGCWGSELRSQCERAVRAPVLAVATAWRRAWRRTPACAVLALAGALVTWGCTEPATRGLFINAVIEADSEVRAEVVDVEARVELKETGTGGWQVRKAQHFEPESPSAWPFTMRVGPEPESENSTYQLIAIARDARGAVLAQARVVTTPARAQRAGLRVTFETSCLRRMQLCGSGLTCSRGECVSAEYDPDAPRTGTTASVSHSSDGGMVPAAPAPSESGIATEGGDCDVDGERRCAGFASTLPLRCEGSTWLRQPDCSAAQHCDTSEGPTRGACRAIPRECVGKTADVPFCTDEMMRVCNADLLGSNLRPCADDERCAPDSQGNASCECEAGLIKIAERCQQPTDCTHENGGCDALTRCEVNGGARTCTTCPPGFDGRGETGCVPKLAELAVATGELVPAFAPETLEYRVRVPLLAQSVVISARAPDNTLLTLNGTATGSGEAWTTPPLSLGENTVDIVVSSGSGMSRTYRVVVDRQGVEDAYIKSSHTTLDQGFGYCVALSGDTLAVCAPLDDSDADGVNGDATDTTARDSGAVFVFVRSGGTWKQQAYLKAGSSSAQDVFGTAVAISGDTLVVGSIRQDPFAVSVSNPPTRYGSAYVFTRSGETWKQQAELMPSPGSIGDGFGASLTLEADTLVVGALADGSFGARGGAAYVYKRTGTNWTPQQKLTPNEPHNQSLFGCAVSLSGDTLAIGAMEDSASVNRGGAVHVFTRRADTWSEQQRIDPRLKEAEFGFSLALRGDRLVVGGPHVMAPDSDQPPGEVRVYDRANGGFVESAVLVNPLPERHDCFGYAVGLGDDLIAVGAVFENGSSRGLGGDPAMRDTQHAGAAYLFARTSQGWKSTTYVKANNPSPDDRFGTSLALSGDTIVVGALREGNSATGVNPTRDDDALPGAGAVYVYR
jgi:hypothetical protein